MADQVGVFNRLGYAASAGATATTEFEFLEGSTLGLTENFISTNGMRGSRSHFAERVRRGLRRVEGNLQFAPTPAELVVLLPLINGAAASGTSYPLGETITLFELFAVRDGTTYHYDDCGVDSATFSAEEGGPLRLSMSVIGKDEILEGSIGSNTVDDSTLGPFVLSDLAVTVGGTAYECSSIEWTIRNHLEVKHRNSNTPTQIKATDRTVEVGLPFSLGTAAALYGSAVGGVTVVATFTNGAVSLIVSFVKVQTPKAPLPFGQRGILDLPWRGVARKSGTTAELVTTLDSTP